MKWGTSCYNDGSKNPTGTRAGIKGTRPRVRFTISVGKMYTLSQTKVITFSG